MIKPRVSDVGAFTDGRGEFFNPWKEDFSGPRWVEDDFSISAHGVLRGIHGDGHTAKLISCITGEIFFVVVNPLSNEWSSVVLSDRERKTVEVSPLNAIGYEVVRGPATVFYKQSERYGTYPQFTIRWDDPFYGIDWPIKAPILSRRDAEAPLRANAYADV